jgi:hypothetical protein
MNHELFNPEYPPLPIPELEALGYRWAKTYDEREEMDTAILYHPDHWEVIHAECGWDEGQDYSDLEYYRDHCFVLKPKTNEAKEWLST